MRRLDENRYAHMARERARKLRGGGDYSTKGTARILSDAAQEIDRLELRDRSVKMLESKLAVAEAWRAGYLAARKEPKP